MRDASKSILIPYSILHMGMFGPVLGCVFCQPASRSMSCRILFTPYPRASVCVTIFNKGPQSFFYAPLLTSFIYYYACQPQPLPQPWLQLAGSLFLFLSLLVCVLCLTLSHRNYATK